MATKNNISVLKDLYESSLRLLSINEIENMYQSISEEALKFTRGKETRIILKVGRSLKTVYVSSAKTKNVHIRKEGFTTKALQSNTVIAIDKKIINKSHPEFENKSIGSVIFIPLGFENNVIGVLIIRFHLQVNMTEEQSEFLKLFGSMASLALQKMQALNETAEALHKRDIFIGMAAHELRTPLTSLGIYSELIHNHVAQKKLPPIEWGDKLRNNIARMTKLVNELLQVKQIQRGRLNYSFEKCQLKEIIQAAIINFSFTDVQRQVVFQNSLSDDDGYIDGDFDKLLQVITNLLNNAAKFSPSDSQITISLGKNTLQDVVLTVKDKGKGIAKKDIPHIFKEFYRGENNQAEGMGLGLYLSKKIIAKHRGKITIDSQKDVGTNVSITLPIIQP